LFWTVSLFWQFYLVMACFTLLLSLPGLLSPQRKPTVWLFLSFTLGLFALHFLAVSPVKPFMQFQRDITSGMTIQEVQGLFSQRFPESGRFRQPEWVLGDGSPVTPYDNEPHLVSTPNQSLHYTLDPTDGRCNAEWLIVYFQDGKAVGTEYLGD
jgi:hypothetical protein